MKEKEDEQKNESDCFVLNEELNSNDPPFWEKRFGLNQLLGSKVKG